MSPASEPRLSVPVDTLFEVLIFMGFPSSIQDVCANEQAEECEEAKDKSQDKG